MKVHYVMPMAGRGSRFNKDGFDLPKPLLEIYGMPFFYWATRSISKFIELSSINFVVLQEHIEKFSIDKVIKKFFPKARIIALPKVTEGAVITSMKGIEEINDDLPIIFNDCDHLFKSEKFNEFCSSQFDSTVDGILLTFEANEPKYSFVEKDSNGDVIRTIEKEAISNEAICGCYYFKNKDVFLKSAEKYLINCNYNEYFMSGVYNVMLQDNWSVKSRKTDFHVPFGVPEEYIIAKKSEKYKELL